MAAEDVVKEWVGIDKINDIALDLFLNKHFEGVWSQYNGFNADSVPLSQAQHFLRELFMAAPTGKSGNDPKAIGGFETSNVYEKDDIYEKHPSEPKQLDSKELKEADVKSEDSDLPNPFEAKKAAELKKQPRVDLKKLKELPTQETVKEDEQKAVSKVVPSVEGKAKESAKSDKVPVKPVPASAPAKDKNVKKDMMSMDGIKEGDIDMD